MSDSPLRLGEKLAWGLLGLVGFIGLWTLLSVSGIVPRQFLPSPLDVLTRTLQLSSTPFAGATLPQHLASSLQRYALGVLLAAGIGVPLGLLMGWFRLLDDIVTPLFDGLRFIAPIAWVPFAALWFGTGIGGPVLIIFAGAFPPCLISAYRGAKFVDTRLLEASRTLGASGPRIVAEVLLPASLPSILAGLRVSAGIGWQSLVGAELIVVGNGIGYMMVQGQLNVATNIVMAGMIAIGIVGICIDVALRMFEQRLKARWGR